MKFKGQNYINGEFRRVTAGDKFYKINPSTEEALGEFPNTHKQEVAVAVDSAREAFNKWRKVSRLQRAEYFNTVANIVERRKDEIAKIISLETGKNYNESIAEVNEALHMAQFAFGSGRTPIGEAVASELPEKDSYMLRKPKGVIAIVSPFNFPVAIGAFWCAAPAIVEGNTVVLKPSEDAPMSSQICAEIFDEAGLPAGVFNVIHGDGTVGNELIHRRVDHVCFTGSAEVGMHIRKVCAESWHKTSSCEMGSKSAVMVFEDANFELAIQSAIASAFKLSGQRCVSSGRMIVHRSILKKFADEFVKRAKELKTDNPFVMRYGTSGTPDAMCWEIEQVNEDMFYGPIVNLQGLEKVQKFNDLVSKDKDVQILLKGERLNKKGFFMSPMVYISEWDDKPFLKQEVFGPHVSIIPFDTIDEAIEIYNDTEYGLAVGVVTEDFKKARKCRDECDFGMCYWNGGSIAAESHLAFGGVKKSGNGFPSAARTYRAVTHEISWTVNHADDLMFPQGMK